MTAPDDLGPFFGPVHRSAAERVRALAAEVLRPAEDRHARWEADFAAGKPVDGTPQSSPDERAAELAHVLHRGRVLGFAVPERWGGLPVERPDDLDVRVLCLVREHLSWASGLADTTFAMQGLGSYPIARFGTDAQRREWLPPIARGEVLSAFALTEPGAGSDVASMSCRARRDGSDYLLDGVKTFISNAGVAESHVLFATLEPGNKKAITAFLLRGDEPGFDVVERLPAIADHPLGTIRLAGCRIPESQRLGAEGTGLRIALSTLDVFRTTVGAAALGIARRALDEALARSQLRRQFGRPLADQQQIQAYLAESATELDAARLLVHRAAWLRDTREGRVTREAAMAKLYATEAAQRIVDRALQIHGGLGVLRGVTVERLYREVRSLRIYEGTSEIQRLVIASDLLHRPNEGSKSEDPG